MAALGRTGRIGLALAALFVLLALVLALREGLDLGAPLDRPIDSSDAGVRSEEESGPTLVGRPKPTRATGDAGPVDLGAVDRERDLHGIVVDAEGHPVAGARLVVLYHPTERILIPVAGRAEDEVVEGPETASAADGTFALRLSHGVLCDLRAEKAGYARLTRAWVQAGERVRVVMRAGVSVLVTVVDENGRTLPGTGVVLSRIAAYGDVAVQREGRADANGQCLFEDLPPDVEVHLNAYPEDGGWSAFARVTLPKVGRVERELELRHGREVRGRVADARTAAPIEGARVGKSFRFVGEVRTDAQGVYVVPQWRSQGYRCLHVLAEGYARMQRRVHDTPDLDFALVPERPVVGRLIDTLGAPVSGAPVGAVASLLGRDYVHELSAGGAVSDEDGRFRIGGLRRDLRHVLVVTASGFGRILHWFGPLGDDDAPLDLGDLVLPTPRRLTGRIVDADGSPCARATVSIRGPIHDDEVPRPAMGPPRYGESLWRYADDLGRFAFSGLAPGVYALSAKPKGGPRVRRRIRVVEEADLLDLEIRLPSTDALRVVIEADDGTPLRGVRVYLQTAGPDGTTSVLTDEAGTVEFATARPPSSVRLQLSETLAASWLTPGVVAWPFGEQELRLTLTRAYLLSGRAVHTSGDPLPRAEVVAERGGTILQRAWLDSDSAFEMHLADANSVDVVLTGRQYTTGGDGRSRLFRQPFQARVDGVRPGTEPVHLVAQAVAAGRRLTLRVLSPGGEPVVGAWIGFLHARPASVPVSLVTDEDGVARLEGLDARPLAIQVAPPKDVGAAWAPARLDAVTADGQEIVVRLRGMIVVTGRVLRPNGRPARGAVVRVEGARGGVAVETDGTFALTLHPDQLPALLRADAERLGGGRVEGHVSVEDAEPEVRADIQLR